MLNAIAALIFRIAGWKIIGRPPYKIKKAVWVGAPHNSNWDFMLCLGARGEMKINVGFLAKSQLSNGIQDGYFGHWDVIPFIEISQETSLKLLQRCSINMKHYILLSHRKEPEKMLTD